LPKIRGMNVTEWSILLGQETGISIHFVSPGVDLGDVLYTQKFSIEKGDTLESIRLKCQQATSAAFVKVVKDIKENRHIPEKQNITDGEQYFIMNPLLKRILKKKLESL
jgi:methionyl-tRNA formyltransferase